MLWNPRVGVEGAQESGVDPLRKWVEPLYTVPLFLLAIAGFFFVPPTFRALAGSSSSTRRLPPGCSPDDPLPRAVGLRARATRRRRARAAVVETRGPAGTHRSATT